MRDGGGGRRGGVGRGADLDGGRDIRLKGAVERAVEVVRLDEARDDGGAGERGGEGIERGDELEALRLETRSPGLICKVKGCFCKILIVIQIRRFYRKILRGCLKKKLQAAAGLPASSPVRRRPLSFFPSAPPASATTTRSSKVA
jgi:hypothetical protein